MAGGDHRSAGPGTDRLATGDPAALLHRHRQRRTLRASWPTSTPGRRCAFPVSSCPQTPVGSSSRCLPSDRIWKRQMSVTAPAVRHRLARRWAHDGRWPSVRQCPDPAAASTPASVPATVCVRPLDGPWGSAAWPACRWLSRRPGSTGAGAAAHCCLVPTAGRQERSLFASAGAIFSSGRAVPPGIVGAWTYPVLLFVVLPLSWLIALLLLARGAAGRPLSLRGRVLRPAALIASIAFVNAALVGPDHAGLQCARRTRPLRLRAVPGDNRAHPGERRTRVRRSRSTRRSR